MAYYFIRIIALTVFLQPEILGSLGWPAFYNDNRRGCKLKVCP